MDDQPLTYSVDYPDRPLNRLTTAFRIFTVIPIAIVLAAIMGYQAQYDGRRRYRRHGGDRRNGTARDPAAAHDLVPPEVPALVVRLEPRAAALHRTAWGRTSRC